MTEDALFEQWWGKHQDEIWEATLTNKERADGKKHSPIWGVAFKNDARAAWMARAALTHNGEASSAEGLGNQGATWTRS